MRFIRRFKLVDWCLQVITENLSLFIYNKTLPQKQIDFLHRVYCREIFLRYKCSNSISEDCMLWFLNPHSKRIFLSTITEKVVSRLQIVGPNITSLSLYQSLAAEHLLNSIVCCVPHVKHLNLSETFCSDRTLLCVQSMCRELVHLNIRDCDAITDKGMRNLCGGVGPELEYLDMMFTHVEMTGLLIILKNMPSLQCVKYENMASSLFCIHKEEFLTGASDTIEYGLTEMTYDRIQYYDPAQVVMLWTIICPKVKKVNFKFLVCEEALQICTKFRHLTDINIARSIFDDYVMNDVICPILPTSTYLRTLILSSVRISVVSLLENFRNLKCLHLHQVVFIDSAEDSKMKNPEMRLDTLVITNMDFKSTPEMYKSIAFLISLNKSVRRLHLTHLKNLPQEVFQIILNTMKNLIFVNFSYSQVQVNTVIPFFRVPTMEMVYLDLCACFAVDQHPMFQNIMAQRSNCTLSWRSMIDSIDEYDSDILSD